MNQKMSSLPQACQLLLSMQKKTQQGQGYAVCGLLVAEDGTLIHADSNKVIGHAGEGLWWVRDPTCHGEMHLMYWYWSNRARLNLPPPQKLTIVTTLDPCIMCTGSVLLSGFNIGTISLDQPGGVDYGHNAFEDYGFAPKLKERLLERFGYFAVEGDAQRGKYLFGAESVFFKEGIIPHKLEKDIAEMFFSTVERIKQQFFVKCHPKTQQLSNLKALSEEDPLIKQLKKLDQQALNIQLKEKVLIEGQENTSSFQPTQELKQYLTKLVDQNPKAKNAVALIDPFGNLLLARSDNFDISPIHTAIINLIVDYGKFYFEQVCQASKEGIPFKQSKGFSYLPSIYNCSLVYLNNLVADDAVSWQAVGVYTYSINRPSRKGSIVYINKCQAGAVALNEVMHKLPPMYGEQFIDFKLIPGKIAKKSQ